jgi:hypothetical protein
MINLADSDSKTIETHPVQVRRANRPNGQCPKVVTMRAYEVYCHLYGKQEALVTGECRGGFGANELIAFLYAASFPKSEWRMRAEEAFTGMEGI